MTISALKAAGLTLAATLGFASAAITGSGEDGRAVAGLDVEYQAAVKRNDAAAMARLLDERFVLVLGDGRIVSRADLLDQAAHKTFVYEKQDEEAGTQTVRVFGDTAVVTAKLVATGVRTGAAFDKTLWFSDTYVRTPKGWRYAFGQASSALPK